MHPRKRAAMLAIDQAIFGATPAEKAGLPPGAFDMPAIRKFPSGDKPIDRGFNHKTKYRPRKSDRKHKRKAQKVARRKNRER